jgi:hypothetical protein
MLPPFSSRTHAQHLETFLTRARRLHGEGYPRFIEREFRRYLDCGLLCHGFARIRCPGCGHEQLLAFSCKGRLCPSCVGRRMADTAAYLVDQLLPAAGYRQWVLTFPWVLRFRLAVDRPLLTALLRTFLRALFAWQRRPGRLLAPSRPVRALRRPWPRHVGEEGAWREALVADSDHPCICVAAKAGGSPRHIPARRGQGGPRPQGLLTPVRRRMGALRRCGILCAACGPQSVTGGMRSRTRSGRDRGA